MTFYYLDNSLSTQLGHHCQSARAIVGELRKRQIPVNVFAHQSVTKEIQDELGAVPLFRASSYFTTTGDPVCGWLEAFLASAEITTEDLDGIYNGKPPEVGDIVYLNSGQPAQLYGLVKWMQTYNPTIMPHCIIEFGVDPGVNFNGQDISVRDPRIDARGTLYHFVGRQIPDKVLSKLSTATFEKGGSEAYQALLGRPVSTLPVPRGAVGPIKSRVGKEPITIAAIGHSRGEKGSGMLPEIVKATLRSLGGKVRFLLHNGAPEQAPELQRILREMAASDIRITVDERLADDKIWAELLDKTDLMLMPYDPQRFLFSYSAVCCEAIANGMPMVIPASTSMQRQGDKFKAGYTMFRDWSVISIAAAIEDAVTRFDELAEYSSHALHFWDKAQGASKTVEAMLEMAAP